MAHITLPVRSAVFVQARLLQQIGTAAPYRVSDYE